MNRAIYNAIVASILSTVLFLAPSVYLSTEGLKTLYSGRNTHGVATVISSSEAQDFYGKCHLTIEYTVAQWSEPFHNNVSLICMPDAIEKKIEICYNFWRPENFIVNDWQLTGDSSACSHIGHSAAMRCLWIALFLLCAFLSILAFVWTLVVQNLSDHRRLKRNDIEML